MYSYGNQESQNISYIYIKQKKTEGGSRTWQVSETTEVLAPRVEQGGRQRPRSPGHPLQRALQFQPAPFHALLQSQNRSSSIRIQTVCKARARRRAGEPMTFEGPDQQPCGGWGYRRPRGIPNPPPAFPASSLCQYFSAIRALGPPGHRFSPVHEACSRAGRNPGEAQGAEGSWAHHRHQCQEREGREHCLSQREEREPGPRTGGCDGHRDRAAGSGRGLAGLLHRAQALSVSIREPHCRQTNTVVRITPCQGQLWQARPCGLASRPPHRYSPDLSASPSTFWAPGCPLLCCPLACRLVSLWHLLLPHHPLCSHSCACMSISTREDKRQVSRALAIRARPLV